MQTVERSASGDTQPAPDETPQKTSQAMRMLEEGISQITDSESFKAYLAFTRSFHNYSPNNTMLIFLQAPDATMVAGYKRWKALGRQVRKGEKAIKILAPILRTETDPDTGERVKKVAGFRDANVFAAEQTDSVNGEPLPAAPRSGAVDGGAETAEAAAGLYQTLAVICASEGIPVSERELSPGHYGYHDPMQSRIVLSTRLSELRKATTLCHELCHYFLHPLRESIALDTATKETEAEGASYAICGHFGIDTSAFSFPYVARHAQDPETLRGVLGRIQKVVGRVLDYDEARERVEEPATEAAA